MVSQLIKRSGYWKHSDPLPTRTQRTPRETQTPTIETSWQTWLRTLFAPYVTAGFAPHHERIWAWLWALEAGHAALPLEVILPRGGAKSTTAELGCVAVGAKRARRYVLYISGTQQQADDHVGNVAGMLESAPVARFYPALADRMVGKFGSSKGWRRNRIRTASGFVVDAIGLDTAARGKKLDQDRPDFIILDDIDEKHDTPLTTAKKIDTLTTSVLPAGSADLAVLAVQNIIHPDSIFAQLADGRADFLAGRTVLGPYKAVEGLRYAQQGDQYIITGGLPTWAGQDLATCQRQMNTWGLRAFLAEAQHEVRQDPAAGIFKRHDIDAHRVGVTDVPDLVRVVVGLDPSGSAGGDEAGIVVAGVDARGHGYVLADRTVNDTPAAWAGATIVAYTEFAADRVVAEVNYGGDMVEATLRATNAGRDVSYQTVHASRGKAIRAEPVAALYAKGRVHHVGTFSALEDQMCGWQPGRMSPGRMDAAVWALTELMLGMGGVQAVDTDLYAAMTDDRMVW